MNDKTAAPLVQGLELFEHYEADGTLLVVTSDPSSLTLEPGDSVVRRTWATAATPTDVTRAAVASPRSATRCICARPGSGGSIQCVTCHPGFAAALAQRDHADV